MTLTDQIICIALAALANLATRVTPFLLFRTEAATPDFVTGLGRFLPEWNLSVFADAAGKACAGVLMEDHFIRASLEMIKGGREQLARALRSSGIKVYPSDTNFILVRTERDLYGELQKHGILIRDCRNFKGLGKGYYRIAVKKHEDDLISFLRFERDL